jgi:N-acetylglucosaminyldiphosphoundecaprenol N-acetyl-beta-D-mannosaminyltransferase
MTVSDRIAMEPTVYIPILGIRVNSDSYAAVLKQVFDWAASAESRYICAANVHMLMEAHDSPAYKIMVNNADIVTPDGMPLVWMMRMKGLANPQRVYGPVLMTHVLARAAQQNTPIGFYGGTPHVLNLLVQRLQTSYDGLNVVYAYSPPFRTLTDAERAEIVTGINQSDARILFIGLGCPKQEIWMSEHRGSVRSVMLGVGAAFDFHAGVKKQAPVWMQNVGLEWLFRLITEPRRLWKRYLYHNPRFIALAVADLLGLL